MTTTEYLIGRFILWIRPKLMIVLEAYFLNYWSGKTDIAMFPYYCFSCVIRAPGGQVKTKGTIYLSNIRMVFVPNKPVGNFFAFDMPLVSTAILKVGSLYLLT